MLCRNVVVVVYHSAELPRPQIAPERKDEHDSQRNRSSFPLLLDISSKNSSLKGFHYGLKWSGSAFNGCKDMAAHNIACAFLCGKKNGCSFWSYLSDRASPLYGSCCLYKGTQRLAAQRAAISGTAWRYDLDIEWDKNYAGEDLANYATRGHLECASKCGANRQCHAWVLTKSPQGFKGWNRCFLKKKHSVGHYTPAMDAGLPRMECGSGYERRVGDMPGWGKVNKQGGGKGVSSCEVCAKMCDQQRDECGSYECSPTQLRCNLNRLWDPPRGSHRTIGLI